MTDTLLGYKELSERWGVSVNALRVRLHRGEMPEPDVAMPRGVAWYEKTITEYEKQGDRHEHRSSGGSGG